MKLVLQRIIPFPATAAGEHQKPFGNQQSIPMDHAGSNQFQ